MGSDSPTAVARSQVQTSPASSVSKIDISLIRTGSASALSRSATCRAASSSIGEADTGAQQMGAVISITGNVLGMTWILPTVLTYVEEVGTLGDGSSSMYVSQVEVVMSRMQLALNVDDLDQAIEFYSKLFNVAPAKRKPGYANFAVAEPPLKLVLLENPGCGGTINHLGVEVQSSEKVHSEIARLSDEGLFTKEEINATCCFATQDKVWVTGPAGEKWEVYTVLADSDTFGTSPRLLTVSGTESSVCCGSAGGPEAVQSAPGTTSSACC